MDQIDIIKKLKTELKYGMKYKDQIYNLPFKYLLYEQKLSFMTTYSKQENISYFFGSFGSLKFFFLLKKIFEVWSQNLDPMPKNKIKQNSNWPHILVIIKLLYNTDGLPRFFIALENMMYLYINQ